MIRPAKLALLLSSAWFVIVLSLFVTNSFRGNEYVAFWTYLFAGLALINLGVWGYHWFKASAD